MNDNLPEAVREYRAIYDAPPRMNFVARSLADAAIDALIEENKRLRNCENCRYVGPMIGAYACSRCEGASEWVANHD